MKKLSLIIIMIVLVSAVLMSSCADTDSSSATTNTSAATSSTSSTPDKVYDLKFNASFPTSHLMYKMDEYFVEQLMERSNGRLNITMYPLGTLTETANVYTGTATGISDIGEAIPAYNAGRFPASDSISVPLPSKSGWVYTHTANDFWQNFQPEENDDVHVLFMDAGSPYVLLSRDNAITKPEDLNGLKIRASGAVASSYVTLLGGVPMGIPMTEAYDAASKGAIDAVLGAADSLKSAKLADVFHYVTKLPTPITSPMIYVMNLDRWNSLPADLQEIITEVSNEMVEAYGRAWYYGEIDGYEYFYSQSGVREVYEIPDEEASLWNDLLTPVAEKYITEKTEAGLPAADYVEYNQERVEYWNNQLIDTEVCKDWINSEILK